MIEGMIDKRFANFRHRQQHHLEILCRVRQHRVRLSVARYGNRPEQRDRLRQFQDRSRCGSGFEIEWQRDPESADKGTRPYVTREKR